MAISALIPPQWQCPSSSYVDQPLEVISSFHRHNEPAFGDHVAYELTVLQECSRALIPDAKEGRRLTRSWLLLKCTVRLWASCSHMPEKCFFPELGRLSREQASKAANAVPELFTNGAC
jgi:hypothetical protein